MLFGQHTYIRADLLRVLPDVKTSHPRPTARWTQQRGQHTNSGCLTSAILPKQSQNLPRLYIKINTIHCPKISIILFT